MDLEKMVKKEMVKKEMIKKEMIKKEMIKKEMIKKEFGLSDSEISQLDELIFDNKGSYKEFLEFIFKENSLNERQKMAAIYIVTLSMIDSIPEIRNKETNMCEYKIECDTCGEPANYFHSRCCHAHMEGIITSEGEFQVVCEECGKYVGTIMA